MAQVQKRGMPAYAMQDEAGLSIALSDPTKVRSRFAAFDPARRNEADILGRADPNLLWLLGLGAGGAAYFGGEK